MSQCQKFSYLKAKSLKAKNICTKNIRAQNTKTDTLEVQSVILNGKDITCQLSQPPIEDHNAHLDLVDDQGKPLRPPRVNEAVFNALLCNAELELQALQERAARGRAVIQQFEETNHCSQCGFTGGVPMSIYGYITKPLLSVKQCGITGSTGASSGLTAIQRMSYNLEVEYDVTVAQSTQARLCTVLCHLAFMEPFGNTGPVNTCSGATGDCGAPQCGPIFVQEIVIGNKQFYPTIDDLYGEMFSGDTYIDSDLIDLAIAEMPDPNNSAAVQLVFFVEEGLSIWSSENARLTDSGITNAKANAGSVEIAAKASCPGDLVGCARNGAPICIQKITPSFNYSFPVFPPLTVNFENTSTGAPGEQIAYSWDFGDGTTVYNPPAPISHTYAVANTYTVTLYGVYSVLFCVAAASVNTSQQVTVSNP
jgi:hypothetical protein